LTLPCNKEYACIVGKNSIILIGMAGAGKSTVGLALARALGYEFTDLDEYLRAREGKTIQQIIDERGEKALLELEKLAMNELELSRRVVAPGGSVIYIPELMQSLRNSSCLVYLSDAFENIEKRLKNAPTRGIVGLKSKTLREIYCERQPLYARYAELTVGIRGKTKEQVVSEILKHMQPITP